MISKFVKGKVAVFIDAANILYSQQTLGWRVDYQRLKTYFEWASGLLLCLLRVIFRVSLSSELNT